MSSFFFVLVTIWQINDIFGYCGRPGLWGSSFRYVNGFDHSVKNKPVPDSAMSRLSHSRLADGYTHTHTYLQTSL